MQEVAPLSEFENRELKRIGVQLQHVRSVQNMLDRGNWTTTPWTCGSGVACLNIPALEPARGDDAFLPYGHAMLLESSALVLPPTCGACLDKRVDNAPPHQHGASPGASQRGRSPDQE